MRSCVIDFDRDLFDRRLDCDFGLSDRALSAGDGERDFCDCTLVERSRLGLPLFDLDRCGSSSLLLLTEPTLDCRDNERAGESCDLGLIADLFVLGE